jgi:hypothetical protein
VTTYDLILNVDEPDSAHPREVEVILGLEESVATEAVLVLNQGGYLREGVTAHYVTSEPADEETRTAEREAELEEAEREQHEANLRASREGRR